jgi:5-methylcytosine-specific restriction enzyme A
MSRVEFSKAIKREAKARSGDLCEAVGTDYNLEAGKRCNMPLGKGVQYDHINAMANDDNSIENCAAVCISCHAYKTAKIDIPRHAKVKRVSDKHNGISRPKQKIKSRGFGQFESNVKQSSVRF